jgi:hypothetical protein
MQRRTPEPPCPMQEIASFFEEKKQKTFLSDLI